MRCGGVWHRGVPGPDRLARRRLGAGCRRLWLGALRCRRGSATSARPPQTDEGGGFHLCAAFLPTMERTTIDISERDSTFWNVGLLSLAGSVAHAYFADEQAQLLGGGATHAFLGGNLAANAKVKLMRKRAGPADARPAPDAPPPAGSARAGGGARVSMAEPKAEGVPKEEGELTPKLVSLLRAHTFTRTTPADRVGRTLLSAFLARAERLVVPSTVGAQPVGPPT